MRSYSVQVIFREYLEGIIAAIFLAVFLRFFVLSILYIPGPNMEPGLKSGDFVMGWRLAYGFPIPLMDGQRLNQKMPQRGDVVSFRFPGDIEQIVIRRVIGIPGDKVSMKEGKWIINGEPLEYFKDIDRIQESLPNKSQNHDIKGPLSGEMKELKIPKGKFFVLSDHRKREDDSRAWGLVPLKNIESRIALIWLSVENTESGMSPRFSRLFQWVK